MNEREEFIIKQEYDLYNYFILKHGPRITGFKVPKAQTGDINTFIKNALTVYSGNAEIYPICLEEYLDIRKLNAERRRMFKRIRQRNIKIAQNPTELLSKT